MWSLLLTLNKFHTLLWCFYCWLWASKYQLDWANFGPMIIFKTYQVGIYLLKVNDRNTKTRYEICSIVRIKTPERCQWRRSGIFILNFEGISYLVLVFLLLTLNMLMSAGINLCFLFTPWKWHRSSGFLMLSGRMEKEHRPKMDWVFVCCFHGAITVNEPLSVSKILLGQYVRNLLFMKFLQN